MKCDPEQNRGGSVGEGQHSAAAAGQGDEGKGQAGGVRARRLPAVGTASPGVGCSTGRLQQAAGGNRLCFLTAGLT